MDHNALDYELARSVGEYFRLNNEQMDTIIKEVISAVKTWKDLAKTIGIPNKEQNLLEVAFKV
jgi:serine/threonine-protein kinase HipA|tara:strand:+ start:1029 stop:1217 length:189 start_codon:yes stop_codon:yes gene_type:complete